MMTTQATPVEQKTQPLLIAGMASIGAGAIHAAAVGVHAEHRQAAFAFILLAALQLAWGSGALRSGRQAMTATGLLLSLGAIAGWAAAASVGIGLIDGLEVQHSPELSDTAAAALAALAGLACLQHLLLARVPRDRSSHLLRYGRAGMASAIAIAALAGLTGAGTHTHSGGHSHGPASAVAPVPFKPTNTLPAYPEDANEVEVGQPETTEPEQQVNLSGVPGVTPEQQKRAEDMVELTLKELPQFANFADAEKLGFHSIGDGFLGHEHFINWDYINDGKVLDPNYPESLVYETGNGGRRLVSAMFMLGPGKTLNDVPELGGKLTQWHIHDNLCFSAVPPKRVAGITTSAGKCSAGLIKLEPFPMIHVWIVPNVCGPFAALEGIAAGQVKPGEEHLCDELHSD